MAETEYERIPSLSELHPQNNLDIPTEEKPTVFVYYLVFCVCIGGFLFGYDTGGKDIRNTLYVQSVTKLNYYYYSHIRCIATFAR